MPIKLGINGAAGRMGKAVVAAAGVCDDIAITAAIELSTCSVLGEDVGVVAGEGALGVAITDDLTEAIGTVDVLIDFTTAATLVDTLACCRTASKTPIVIGTTGLGDTEHAAIAEAANDLAIVLAPNMSVGVNLCLELIERAARVLGEAADIEIIEAHHKHKQDAPSGTALQMGRVVADALGRDLSTCAVYDRHGITGEREPHAIGFSTIRAGDIVGEHMVLFAAAGERVEVRHVATSRETFASGAIRAARWVAKQPTGLFAMRDVLG